jgi:hypothetical protein
MALHRLNRKGVWEYTSAELERQKRYERDYGPNHGIPTIPRPVFHGSYVVQGPAYDIKVTY